jgi:hypothetical protein
MLQRAKIQSRGFGKTPERVRLRDKDREPQRLVRAPNYCGSTSGPVLRDEPMRDRTLLDMAHGRPCLLLVPGCCNHRLDTTVACHRNEGKGMGLKQSDEQSCWGCAACHRWYDQSGAPREVKRAAFDAAYPRQVQAWQQVAADPAEPRRFRNAARRALAQIESRKT